MIGHVPDLTAKRAQLSPDSIAFEEAATGRTLTYAELDRRSAQAASLLASRSIGAGDRVAILCRNRVAFFELLFGCAKLGAILVPLNWRMPPPEMLHLIDHAQPALLVFGTEDSGMAAQLGMEAIGLDAEYESLIAEAERGQWPAQWSADAIWYLLYTSGTTGAPKGVIYTHRMALANYMNIRSAVDLRTTDTTANFLPLFHTAGINLSLIHI